jgi:transcription elongation GreA/GreB family factor
MDSFKEAASLSVGVKTLEKKVLELEEIIKNAEIIKVTDSDDIQIGREFEINIDGNDTRKMQLVSALES